MLFGPNGICICDECVESCREQILDARARTKTGAQVKLLKPAEIKERLDDYIIGQDRAKRVLSVAVYNGETLLADDCTGYDGTEFVYGSLNYLCAGNRVLVELGPKPSGIDSATLTIKWLRGGTAVKTETREFDWFHTPQYFKRPAGEGNYKLKTNNVSSSAGEVYYAGSWMDFPSAGLSSLYAGCPVRLKTEPSLQTIVCWTCDGADGDPFWYLT